MVETCIWFWLATLTIETGIIPILILAAWLERAFKIFVWR